MGHKLALAEEIDVAAKAGWQGVEPWIRNIRRYVDEGGSLADLKKRIDDLGLKVVSAIGFTGWAVDDDAKRAENVEQFKEEMEGKEEDQFSIGFLCYPVSQAADILFCKGEIVPVGNDQLPRRNIMALQIQLPEAVQPSARHVAHVNCRRAVSPHSLHLRQDYTEIWHIVVTQPLPNTGKPGR